MGYILISQERLKIEVKLLLSADRKSCMPCRLAQQPMTLSEWPFHASRAVSAVAEPDLVVLGPNLSSPIIPLCYYYSVTKSCDGRSFDRPIPPIVRPNYRQKLLRRHDHCILRCFA